MQQDTYDKMAFALAGMVQALALMREIAYTGLVSPTAFYASMHSIFMTHPHTIEEIYGEPVGLECGLHHLHQILRAPLCEWTQSSPNISSLFRLQQRLQRSPKILANLSTGLQTAYRQLQFCSPIHPTVVAHAADLYLDSIGTFHYRLDVVGFTSVFSKTESLDKLRALVLAGVRAAVLWKQMGGSLWHFLFHRQHLLEATERWIAQLAPTPLYLKESL